MHNLFRVMAVHAKEILSVSIPEVFGVIKVAAIVVSSLFWVVNRLNVAQSTLFGVMGGLLDKG